MLALSSAGLPIGWTGGKQSTGQGAKGNVCVVQPGVRSLSDEVAAGKGGDVFVLAPEFMREFEEEEPEIIEVENEKEEIEYIEEEPNFEPLKGAVNAPAIIEFGPGGSGCEKASAEGITEQVNEKPVKETETFPAGTEVKFGSVLKNADATKVEWTFELEGTKESVVQTDEILRQHENVEPESYRDPSLRHKFTRAGKWQVAEKIYSDDLAGFGAEQALFNGTELVSPWWNYRPKKTLTVNIEKGPPTAQFIYAPGTPITGEKVTFTNKSTDPNGSKTIKYEWSFGDGASSTEQSPTHAYAAAKTYTVTLVVSDEFGLKAKVEHTITVLAPKVETKHEETHNSPPPPTYTPPPPPPPSQGVLSYEASIAGSSVSVSPSGALTIKVDCGGKSSCAGTVTLRTLSAVAAGSKHKAILTLASASFSIAGGQAKSITLHLSAKARVLLADSHVLHARATIVGRDSSGATHTTSSTVTLKLTKASKGKHH